MEKEKDEEKKGICYYCGGDLEEVVIRECDLSSLSQEKDTLIGYKCKSCGAMHGSLPSKELLSQGTILSRIERLESCIDIDTPLFRNTV